MSSSSCLPWAGFLGRMWKLPIPRRRASSDRQKESERKDHMLMKTKWISRVLCGLVAAGLLCGFAALPAEENADLVPRQFQTAQQIDRIRVEDAISNVTIRTADTDHITVDYADTTEKPLYTISVEDGLLSIQTTTEEFEKTSISVIKIGGKTVSEHPNHDLVITLPQKQY